MSSSSSASAGSGENRLDRRGEAEPVLTMPGATSSNELPRLWLRTVTTGVIIPGLESFPREEGVRGLEEDADSRQGEGLCSSSRIPFRDVYGKAM